MFKSLFAVIVLSIASFSASAAIHFKTPNSDIVASSDFSSMVIVFDKSPSEHYHLTRVQKNLLNNYGEQYEVYEFTHNDNPNITMDFQIFDKTMYTIVYQWNGSRKTLENKYTADQVRVDE